MPDDHTTAPDTASKRRLNGTELAAINFIEQTWLFSGEWPSIKEILARPGLARFSLSDALADPIFVSALNNRGVDIPNLVKSSSVEKTQSSDLTPAQVACIMSLTNFHDRRSQAAKLKDLGISSTQYRGWIKNKSFKNFLHNASTTNFEDSLDHAHAGLMTAVDKGDVNAIKFYLEMTGRYNSAQDNPEIQNLKIVMAKLFEAIQRVITDPLQLAQLQQEFDYVLSGGSVEKVPVPVESNGVKLLEGI